MTLPCCCYDLSKRVMGNECGQQKKRKCSVLGRTQICLTGNGLNLCAYFPIFRNFIHCDVIQSGSEHELCAYESYVFEECQMVQCSIHCVSSVHSIFHVTILIFQLCHLCKHKANTKCIHISFVIVILPLHC